jgi:hypothetical protein
MNTSKPSLLNTKLTAMLATGKTTAAATAPQSHTATQEGIKPSENIKQSNDETAKPSRRDIFLHKLPATQQLEILKWAEQQNIKPDEALWLLVDLLGYTQYMTQTLPSQMRAAGQHAVDAIAQQRRAEADVFSSNAQKALRQMLAGLTAQVAHDSENISELRLRKKLWIHGLWVGSGIMVLAAMCFVFGYTFGNVHLYWFESPSSNAFIRIIQVILGAPVGYILLPIVITAIVLGAIDEIYQWRRQRQLDKVQNTAWYKDVY